MTEDADRLIVERMARGDGAALAEFYDRHGRVVFSLAARILSDQSDAEDLTQDVFALAWSNAARYDPARGAVAAWLLVIARTRAIDKLRARRVRPAIAAENELLRLDAIPDRAPSVEMIVADRQMSGRVRDALAGLPADQRLALELAYFEGLSHSEIGERTGTPLGTIKTRIRTGLMRLRQAMHTGKEG
jgi:RNA polymerase sigma-70 factor, ECF subfamily